MYCKIYALYIVQYIDMQKYEYTGLLYYALINYYNYVRIYEYDDITKRQSIGYVETNLVNTFATNFYRE